MRRVLKSERLRTSGDFKAVFQKCRKLDDGMLVFYVQFAEDAALRKFGVSLGRTLGKAVLRNRLKRCLREIYRVEKERFRGGYQLIVVPKRGSAGRNFEEIQGSFLALATRAGLLPRRM